MNKLIGCFNEFDVFLQAHQILPLHAVIESIWVTAFSDKFASSSMAAASYNFTLFADCIEISLVDIADIDCVWCGILNHHHIIHVVIHIHLLITGCPSFQILQIFSEFLIFFIQWQLIIIFWFYRWQPRISFAYLWVLNLNRYLVFNQTFLTIRWLNPWLKHFRPLSERPIFI